MAIVIASPQSNSQIDSKKATLIGGNAKHPPTQMLGENLVYMCGNHDKDVSFLGRNNKYIWFKPTYWKDGLSLVLPGTTRDGGYFHYKSFEEAKALIKKHKPKRIISVDAPMHFAYDFFNSDQYKSSNANGLQALFDRYTFDEWIITGWMKPLTKKIKRTNFVSLGIGDSYEI